MPPRRFALLALVLLPHCAEAIAPVDPGDGATEAGDARDENLMGSTDDGGRDAGPVPCNENIRDGDRCATTHDYCLLNLTCGVEVSCDCGSDGLWHCSRTGCDGGR